MLDVIHVMAVKLLRILGLCTPWRRPHIRGDADRMRSVVSQLAILITVLAAWTVAMLWLRILENKLFGVGVTAHGRLRLGHSGFSLERDVVVVLLYVYFYIFLMFGIFVFAAMTASLVCYCI